MITCLMFKKPYDVKVSDSGKFNLVVPTGDGTSKVEKQDIKDIPFIRYRLSGFSEDKVDDKYSDVAKYIKGLKGIFKYSAHLAELDVNYSAGNSNADEVLEGVKTLKESVDKLCVFVYLNLTDEWLAYVNENDAFPDEVENLLYDLLDLDVDQVCVRDRTSAIGEIMMNNVRKRVADIVYGDDKRFKSVAVCESPLAIEDSACLTAAKARELMAIYCDDALEQPTPSANHECQGCDGCGCIKYIEITSDIQAVSSANKAKSSSSGDKPKEPKKPKEKTSNKDGDTVSKKTVQGAVDISSFFF